MSIVNLNGQDFKEFVSKDGIVVVDFWASWCAPCKAMKPVMEEISKEGKVLVGFVDVEEECGLAGEHGVSSLPHFSIYKNGELVDTIQGALPPVALKNRIDKHL